MKEIIEKIITDIEIHKDRKYCANIHQTLRDDGYVPSICNFIRSVRPVKITKLIAYIRDLENKLDAALKENEKYAHGQHTRGRESEQANTTEKNANNRTA